MDNQKLITVVICTWNRAPALARTLEQLTHLRIPAGMFWELLIVNNCCTDSTDDVIAAYAGRLPIRRLYEATPGQTRARNLAIREGRGSIVMWTDDDVLVDPDWAIHLLNAFARFDADWVFGPAQAEWETQAPSWYADRFAAHFALLDYGSTPFLVTDRQHPFYGLNCASTRDALHTLGGFCVDFGLRGASGAIGDDIDIFDRALEAHLRIVYTPDAKVRHMIPAARVTKRYYRTRFWRTHEAAYKFLPATYPAVTTLLGIPRFMFPVAAQDAMRCAGGILRGDESVAFYSELRLIRFAGLLYEAACHGFRVSRHSPSQPIPEQI